ncbi:MAG TPA: hypothetical protein VGI20_12230 [Rhizomicrobium sp.]|jgi:predicted nucleic acid-binding protein
MSYSSCLADITADLILDASVFINLSASGVAEEILRALPQRAFMVDIAASEVQLDSRTGRSDSDTLQGIVGPPTLCLVNLDEHGLALFEKLVPVLDDGEAATIAAAVSRRAIVVVDERKARRVCAKEFPDTPHASTIDLFAHAGVVKEFGRNKLAEALYAALKNARMCVRADQRDWVVDLVGRERAVGCGSIPRPHKFRKT